MEKRRKMTEDEQAARLERFRHWRSTIANRIQQWKSTLPASIAEKLDMSAESLVILEQYLVDNFPDRVIFFDPSNSQTIDAVCTYIGEVYRLNLPGDVVWICGDDEIREEGPPQFHFAYEIGYYFTERREYLTRHIPYVLYNKTKDHLLEYLRGGLTRNFTSSIESYERAKTEIPIPGIGGYSYQHFLLLRNTFYGVKDLERSVRTYYAKRTNGPKVYLANEARLVVEFTKEFCFHFWLDDRSYVVPEESKEISEQYMSNKKDRDVIAAAKTRIEFWGDDDPKGDYFNEHLFLLSELVKLPDFYIFNFKQGVFYDEM